MKLRVGDSVISYDGADMDEGCEVVSLEEIHTGCEDLVRYSYFGKDKISIRPFIYKMPEEKQRLLDDIEETMAIADWHRQQISENY
jgi:hypothetical protein